MKVLKAKYNDKEIDLSTDYGEVPFWNGNCLWYMDDNMVEYIEEQLDVDPYSTKEIEYYVVEE